MLMLRVAKSEMLTERVRRLVLCGIDGQTLPRFGAGAHISPLVQTRNGWELRNYSLINGAIQGDHYEIAVLRCPAGGGGSLYLCDQLRVGDIVQSTPPRNDFPLHEAAGEAILIAGGIGITPILSMAETLAAKTKSFTIHYSARSPDQMAFLDRVSAVSAGRAHLYFDGGDPTEGIDLAQALGNPGSDRHVYVCGPRGMIDATIAAAQGLNWKPANIHFESFAAPASQDGDRQIEVVARASNRTLQVPPDKSILECLIDAGLDPMFDCKRGECGACITTVVEGVPDHRDYVLDESARAAGASMCICVSRARSQRLVLDI